MTDNSNSTFNPNLLAPPPPTPASLLQPQTTPTTSTTPYNPYTAEKAVFPVIKNAVDPNSTKPIPYSSDPYQSEYDRMLGLTKQELFEQEPKNKIMDLIKAMGGIDNFVRHYKLSNGEFEEAFPEMRRVKKKPPQQPYYPLNQPKDPRLNLNKEVRVEPIRNQVLEVKVNPPRGKPKPIYKPPEWPAQQQRYIRPTTPTPVVRRIQAPQQVQPQQRYYSPASRRLAPYQQQQPRPISPYQKPQRPIENSQRHVLYRNVVHF